MAKTPGAGTSWKPFSAFTGNGELTWHIDAAVRIAVANRIGHGVDMRKYPDEYSILRW